MRTRDSVIAQLTQVVQLASDEDRELTTAEVTTANALRSELESIEVVTRSTQGAPGPVITPNDRGRAGNGHQANTVLREAAEGLTASIGDNTPFRIELPHDLFTVNRAIVVGPAFPSGLGLPGTPDGVVDLASFFSSSPIVSQTPNFNVFDATVAGVVGEAAPKPDIVAMRTVVGKVNKIAGIAIVSSETLMFVANAESAIRGVLTDAIVAGVNKVIVTEASTGTDVAFDTDARTSILGGIAAVAGAYGSPGVVMINPADLTDIAATAAPGDLAFGVTPNGGQVPASIFGLPLVMSPDVTAGEAIVASSRSIEVQRRPIGLLSDPYTLAANNQLRIIAEQFVAAEIVRPAEVAVVDLTAAVTAASASKKS